MTRLVEVSVLGGASVGMISSVLDSNTNDPFGRGHSVGRGECWDDFLSLRFQH
jgi:hypothetical protein